MLRQLVLPTLLVSLALAGCHDSTSPHAGPPAAIQTTSQSSLSGTVGTAIAAPLTVHVTDAKGISVPNVAVTFTAPGGNTLSPTSATTDANGQAQTRLTLRTVAGTFQVLATVPGVVASAAFAVTATPGALAKVVTNGHAATVPTALDTIRLSATGKDQYGNGVSGTTFTWTSRDPATLTVDPDGLVHALKRGGPVFVVATAGPGADSIAVSAPPSPCGSTVATTVNLAQVVTDISAAGLCLRGGTTPSEYALIPFSGASTAESQVSVEITAQGVGTPPLLAIASPVTPNRSMVLGSGSAGLRRTPSLDWSFDWRLRDQARKLLGPRIALARQRVGARAALRSIAVPRANLSTQVGDIVTLNTNANDACINPMPAVARVVAIGDKAIVLADTTSPAGGYTDADYQSFAATFDTLVSPVDVQAFGDPSDLDANGRVLILFTPAVNRLTPAGNPAYVEGFFYERDLFPAADCASSNQAEMFYMIVPDPTGINGNIHTKQEVSEFAVDVLAHEFQHLINGARRLYVNNAPDFEEEWLNEGLSEIAEELMFYRTSGLQTHQNVGTGFLQSQRQVDAYNQYFLNDFSLYITFLLETAGSSPFKHDDGSAEMRGAIWNMLRYTADRTSSIDGDFWYQLVNSTTTGRANMANVLGVTDEGLTGYFRDWSVSLFADDALPGVDARFTEPSWNTRRMLATWFAQSYSYPIQTLLLTDGVLASVILDGGGSVPARFTVPAYQDVFIVVTSNGATPPPEVMLSLVRTR